MIQFYKPNARCTGVCLAINFSTEDEAMYVSMLKQASWDEATKKGSFKANQNDLSKKINIKFALTEVGSILASLRRNEELSLFHKVGDTTVGIKLSPYMRDVTPLPDDITQKSSPVVKQVGYSLSVSRKKGAAEPERFLIGFTFGEAALVEEALVHGLRSIWGAQRASFKKKKTEVVKQEPTAPENTESIPQTEGEELF